MYNLYPDPRSVNRSEAPRMEGAMPTLTRTQGPPLRAPPVRSANTSLARALVKDNEAAAALYKSRFRPRTGHRLQPVPALTSPAQSIASWQDLPFMSRSNFWTERYGENK